MTVTIRIPALWRSAAGGAEQVDLPAGSLGDMLKVLAERFPALRTCLFDDKGEVHGAINLFVNQEHVRFRSGLSELLRDGDQVYIVPMITGGNR